MSAASTAEASATKVWCASTTIIIITITTANTTVKVSYIAFADTITCGTSLLLLLVATDSYSYNPTIGLLLLYCYVQC